MSTAAHVEKGARDFDFWMGSWHVHNRRLRKRLAGSDEWDEFEATVVARPLLDGLGNEDEFRTDHAGGFIGMSFRFFDPKTRKWSIYWADSRRPGLLDPPVVGSFFRRHGRLRGGGRIRRPADRRPVPLVGGHHSDAALGAGVLRRGREDVGDELGHGVHAGRRHAVSAVETSGSGTTDYVHIEKIITPAPTITLDGAILKWYDIAPADAPVPLAVRALARRNLRDASKSGELGLSGDLGFVILHRCGESFYFLLATTWRNDNELWETVWAKAGDLESSFNPWPIETTHGPTFCVWELGAVCHEQQAWSRYLRSARDDRARREYVRDSYEGPV